MALAPLFTESNCIFAQSALSGKGCRSSTHHSQPFPHLSLPPRSSLSLFSHSLALLVDPLICCTERRARVLCGALYFSPNKVRPRGAGPEALFLAFCRAHAAARLFTVQHWARQKAKATAVRRQRRRRRKREAAGETRVENERKTFSSSATFRL